MIGYSLIVAREFNFPCDGINRFGERILSEEKFQSLNSVSDAKFFAADALSVTFLPSGQ